MKNTTKWIATAATAAAIFFTAANVKAQTTDKDAWRLGIGIESGIVTGNFSNTTNWELGATGRLQYGLSNKVALTFTSGYYNLFGSTQTTGVKFPNSGFIPVKVGAKYFFTPGIYLDGEAGAGFEATRGEDTKLLLSPGIGWASKHWDIGARYENISGQDNDGGIVALRLAYGFGL